jgi:hypothetical protein
MKYIRLYEEFIKTKEVDVIDDQELSDKSIDDILSDDFFSDQELDNEVNRLDKHSKNIHHIKNWKVY